MKRTRTIRTARGQTGRAHPMCGHIGSRRAGAFSLMEVLVALGIFALGLVAVAAVFPTAIAIQSETVRDLAGQRAVINARSTIQAMARSQEATPSGNFLTLTYLHDVDPALRKGTLREFAVATSDMKQPGNGRTGFPGRVQPMIDQPMPYTLLQQHTNPHRKTEAPPGPLQLNAPTSFHDLFSEDVRSYPKNIAPRSGDGISQRDYYWYPLIQPRDLTSNNPTWMVYLMVMQRHGTDLMPEVRAARVVNAAGSVIELATAPPYAIDNDADNGVGDGLPDLIQPGDWVLGDDGSIFRVVIAERDRITIDSQVPVGAGLNLIYYAQAFDSEGDPKPEARTPIVRIAQFEIIVNQP